jgi:hypothetical protein
MTAGVVTVGKRAYASGLTWENSPSGRVSQAAKEAAKQSSQPADFYAVRAGTKTGRIPQFGLSFGDSSGHKTGLPSLAACLANQQPGSWAGAFRLREGVGLVVVRDDLIVPDGDVFFADETEARDRLLQEMSIGGLLRVYAPENWGVPGADNMPLSLLLNDRADVRLVAVTIPKQALVIGGAAAALLLLVMGIGWYIQNEKAKDEALRLAREQALADQLLALKQKTSPELPEDKADYPKPDPKWQKEPKPLEFIEACRVALSQVQYVVQGWNSSGFKCDKGGVSLRWSRSSGISQPPPQSFINDAANSAGQNVALPMLKPRGPEKLWDPEQITRRYLLQNWPGTISRAPDDPPPPRPANFQGTWNPPPAPWIKRSFTLSVPVLPWTIRDFLGDVPGVIISSMSYSGGLNGTWSIEGVIYENRK